MTFTHFSNSMQSMLLFGKTLNIFYMKAFSHFISLKKNQLNFFDWQVPIAGDSMKVKNHVPMILDKLGYHVSDRGLLINAQEIENIPLSLFLEWRKPLALSISIWIFLYFFTFGRYNFCDDNKLGWVDGEITQIFAKYIIVMLKH